MQRTSTTSPVAQIPHSETTRLPWRMPTSGGRFMVPRAPKAPRLLISSRGAAVKLARTDVSPAPVNSLTPRPPFDAQQAFYRRRSVADHRSLLPEDGFVNSVA